MQIELRNRFDVLGDHAERDEQNAEKKWNDFEDAYKETAQKVFWV